VVVVLVVAAVVVVAAIVGEVGAPGEIVVVLTSVVVGGAVEDTVAASVEGTADEGGLVAAITGTAVVVVVVLVVATVRGGAVSVTVVAPPPNTPPVAEPSPAPRALVITEPSGRTIMSPSEPPGLIQIRCSSTVTSIRPTPGMKMVWITVPAALRTIIWRVRSFRRYTRPFNTIGAAVNAFGSLRSMRCGCASPLTSNTIPAALDKTGTRSPTTDCSGTLMAPSFGVSDLATMTPLRTRVMRPGSTISVSLLLVTTRALAALLVTVTREVSLDAPLSLEFTETNSPAVVSTWRPRPLSTATSVIDEPISMVSPEALIRVGSNNETLPEGSSATKLRSPATPTRMSVVGKRIAVPSTPAIGSTGSTAPLVSSWTTGLPRRSALPKTLRHRVGGR
jgi:hypothetical protein